MPLSPQRLHAQSDLAATLALIQLAFAQDAPRIAPPSSAQSLTLADLRHVAAAHELWIIGPSAAPHATITLRAQADALSLGKLAVHPTARGKGHASTLIGLAATRAQAQGLAALELHCRVELVENHAIYRHLGFVETARTAHPGFDSPTSVVFRKPL